MLELLSPAGSMEALKAAVQNGADAVYLGLGDFNARRNAKNFTQEEFAEAVRYCHVRGAKLYVTLNTLLSDRELPEAALVVSAADRAGADAILVQDLGALEMIKQVAPAMPIHASTQMSIHNLEGARYCAERGISRVVVARELTKQQIAYICRNSPIEVEVFVHGALCMCYSGQCYMSSVIGRRSGNRGLCAQPCRMAYGFGQYEERYPLSLKDNCLADKLRELEEIGVACVKIEGRMKRPEYVAIATKIYSDAIRLRQPPSDEDMEKLRSAFSRQGFTDGYYEDQKGADMFGVREGDSEDAKLFSAARLTYQSGELQRVPVRYYAIVRADEPVMLAVQDDIGNICKAEGEPPQIAINREMTEEVFSAQLKKSGGTPFYCTGVKAIVDKELLVPLSAINAMRREVLSKLTAVRARREPREEGAFHPAARIKNSDESPEMTISVLHAEQISPELIAMRPQVLYIPLSEVYNNPDVVSAVTENGRTSVAIRLPRVVGDHEMKIIRRQLDFAGSLGITQALVGNLGHIQMARSRGFSIRGDFGLNVFNSGTMEHLRHEGLISLTASFELSLPQIRDLSKCVDTEIIAYGRLPMMVTENCVIKNRAGICGCDSTVELTDRTGVRFPVVREPGSCRNLILNSQKLYLADKYEEYSKIGLWAVRLEFTTENPNEIIKVVKSFGEQSGFEPTGFTRGLYYRGVE